MIFITAICAIVFFWGLGYSDGYFKRNGTVAHLIMWPVYSSFLVIAFLDVSWVSAIGMVVMAKPLIDFGYARGAKTKTFIGTTEFMDKLIRKTWIYKIEFVKKKAPVLTFLYYILIMLGFFIILEGRFY